MGWGGGGRGYWGVGSGLDWGCDGEGEGARMARTRYQWIRKGGLFCEGRGGTYGAVVREGWGGDGDGWLR
jgi:hypothetical protein